MDSHTQQGERVGFWRRVWKRVVKTFSRAEVERVETEPPTGGGGITGDESGGYRGDESYGISKGEGLTGNSPDNPPGSDSLEFDFSIAGFLPLGGSKDDYVNTEGWNVIDLRDFGDIDWPETDYVVIKVYEPGGASYYTTIVGPFDDYWDFLAHVENWWEEGS